MTDTLKKYILFYFNENLYRNYNTFLSMNDFNNCINYTRMYDLEVNGNNTILNVYDDADILNEEKLEEMEKICSIFNEDYFYFLSMINEQGVCFKFPYNFKTITSDESDFYSFLSTYNYWITSNWCRMVSGGILSDIRIDKGVNIDFSHELITVNGNNLDRIRKIYENKYGAIIPILEHKDFFVPIFETEFKYLLADNIYITSNSLDYIKNQI